MLQRISNVLSVLVVVFPALHGPPLSSGTSSATARRGTYRSRRQKRNGVTPKDTDFGGFAVIFGGACAC